eukprot:CAMPEP_0204484048 /NCGR_PEP_ID=MMETSP0471-20130131/56438_1 /ASSEMBLY_ACC=CAM_ASM_000602 /TAXON_ID=2969 /ORGANISM="Oxyrrhis marina" /LENGTH=64 /DNA_ID=CAMNT_0051487427 /DNA_START=104 /DNA_END=295 /DNA_ORIENTATION=+
MCLRVCPTRPRSQAWGRGLARVGASAPGAGGQLTLRAGVARTLCCALAAPAFGFVGSRFFGAAR